MLSFVNSSHPSSLMMNMPYIRSVLRDIPATEVRGPALFHEHLGSDYSRWGGTDDENLSDFNLMLQEIREAGIQGVSVIVDATTPDIGGRTPTQLAEAMRLGGVVIIAAAGVDHPTTGAADGKDVAALVNLFLEQLQSGIGGSAVRAGVLGELPVSPNGPTDAERAVLMAAAQAQRITGAGVITHTPCGRHALAQLDILERAGADPRKVVIGHMDCLDDTRIHQAIAARGAFVGFDRVGFTSHQSDTIRVRQVRDMIEAGMANNVLISSDVARRHRLRVNGDLGYCRVTEDFVPRLLGAGLEQDVVKRILYENPLRLLAIA